MKEKLSLRDWIMRVAAAVLCCCLLAVAVRYGTQRFVVDRLHIDNEITRFITTGHTRKDTRVWKKIDWAKEYPFAISGKKSKEKEAVKKEVKKEAMKKNPKFAEKKTFLFRSLENMHTKKQQFIERRKHCEEWMGRKFFAYYTLVEGKRFYDQLTGWESYNLKKDNLVKVADNRFTYRSGVVKPENIEPRVQAVKNFEKFCRSRGIKFIYVCAPFKVSHEDERLHGKEWNVHINASADYFMKRLRKEKISVLDLRDEIEKMQPSNFSLFFETDHHWKPETALWAAGVLAERLKKMPGLGYEYNPAVLNPKNYKKDIHEKIFLGSQGRKVTLAGASPEDISIFYPKDKTSFHLTIPDRGIDKEGDFSIGYDVFQLWKGDYYNLSAYHAYGYGDRPYIDIVNHDRPDGFHALMIRDSFGDSTAMFLARTLSRLEVLDLRHFTGSTETLIRRHRPNLVIILYNPTGICRGKINWKSHKDNFDFR